MREEGRHSKVFHAPSLNLSAEEECALRSLASDFVEDAVSYFENVMYDQCGSLDTKHYVLLKKAFSVIVHRERREFHALQKAWMRDRIRQSQSTFVSDIEVKQEATERPRSKGSGSKGVGEINGPMAHFLAESELPTMIAVGSVPGTLEEAMLGASFRDTVAFSSIMGSSVKKVLEAQVLATVPDPSQNDTFYYLGVHWTLAVAFSGVFKKISPRYDQSLLVHSKITTTSRGERIGVCILHALKHPDVPEMPSIATRIFTSFALCFREKHDGSVDFVAITSAQSAPPFLYTAMLRRVTAMLCNIPHSVDFANSRKLLAMMLTDIDIDGATSLKEAVMVSSARQRLARRLLPDQCSGCYKILSPVCRSFSSSCKVCKARVCAPCCVTKKITVSGERQSKITSVLATTKEMRFCLACIHAARQLACCQTQLHHEVHTSS
uniref:Uncharacterized protein AlNc14C242G9501 n=1 Tax=Albugo laibachii Nc14 TaxID=890382 RepID=F0WT11_9STRA|nr:conserved hypothetical protein [Albugo laibachii Nc14]|eukprot:CCA24496.1 conserved hypothetical protein [Albugo laibachii Nc14]